MRLNDLRLVENLVQWQQLAQRWVRIVGHVPLEWVEEALAKEETVGHAFLYMFMLDITKHPSHQPVVERFHPVLRSPIRKCIAIQEAFANNRLTEWNAHDETLKTLKERIGQNLPMRTRDNLTQLSAEIIKMLEEYGAKNVRVCGYAPPTWVLQPCTWYECIVLFNMLYFPLIHCDSCPRGNREDTHPSEYR